MPETDTNSGEIPPNNHEAVTPLGAIELDVESIVKYIAAGIDIIGLPWFRRKFKQEQKQREEDKRLVWNRKHAYLYRAKPHPLIELHTHSKQWHEACLKSGTATPNESVLKLAVLGRALESAKSQKGFLKLIARLKRPTEFHAAAFEAEVAASYVARGWAAEFVEEGNERTPDLKITRSDGQDFWVECKCRDLLSERDTRIHAFWTGIESALLRTLGPRKLNYQIVVKSLQDPDSSHSKPLLDFLLQGIENGGIGQVDPKTGRATPCSDPTGEYLVSASLLASPDVEIKANGFQFNSSEDMDHINMLAEMKVDSNRLQWIRNPMVIAFKNAIPTDKVTGIVHAFKSAIGQLPSTGPGVVWIRIPDNAWTNKLDQSFAAAKKLLEAELQGDHNRRVNAAILMTRVFRKLPEKEKGRGFGLAYTPLRMTIEHNNPRFKVTS